MSDNDCKNFTFGKYCLSGKCGCTYGFDCPASVPVCDSTSTGQCVECNMDAHCSNKGKNKRCDLGLKKCVECLEASDCAGRACYFSTRTCYTGMMGVSYNVIFFSIIIFYIFIL